MSSGADDGDRTRDLNLGKVPRYQLRYVRLSSTGLSQCERGEGYRIWLFSRNPDLYFSQNRLKLKLSKDPMSKGERYQDLGRARKAEAKSGTIRGAGYRVRKKSRVRRSSVAPWQVKSSG